jgi:hypothetical protein
MPRLRPPALRCRGAVCEIATSRAPGERLKVLCLLHVRRGEPRPVSLDQAPLSLCASTFRRLWTAELT